MKKGKSRLKVYKQKKRLKKIVLLSSFTTLILWVLVFLSINLLKENDSKPVIIYKPIIQAKEETPEIKELTSPKIAKITAYSCGGLVTKAEILMNCPSMFYGKPKTANGTEPIPNKTMACDEANMGKTFEIEGLGQLTCTDTGGAIKGAGRFDIYLENVSEARQFGVQYKNYKEIK